MQDRTAWSAAPQAWEYFDEAVYEYAQQCALREFTQGGDVGPAGDILWAHRYMPAFFEGFDWDVFDGSALDALTLEEEAKRRFVKEFQEGWSIARSGLD
jgi:hypothetical protein